jgi:hypothetical protein
MILKELSLDKGAKDKEVLSTNGHNSLKKRDRCKKMLGLKMLKVGRS